MRTLKDYLQKIINKDFIDDHGRSYHVESLDSYNPGMRVVYKNGTKETLLFDKHYDDKRVSWFNRFTKQFKYFSKGIKREPPKSIDPLEQYGCPCFESEKVEPFPKGIRGEGSNGFIPGRAK